MEESDKLFQRGNNPRERKPRGRTAIARYAEKPDDSGVLFNLMLPVSGFVNKLKLLVRAATFPFKLELKSITGAGTTLETTRSTFIDVHASSFEPNVNLHVVEGEIVIVSVPEVDRGKVTQIYLSFVIEEE